MGFSLRAIADSIEFSEAVSLNALGQAIPQATVEAVVTDLGVEEQRVRKLPAVVTLLLCIAMGLFTNIALEQVLVKMVKGLRYIWPDDEDYQTANRSAICQARQRLGLDLYGSYSIVSVNREQLSRHRAHFCLGCV